MVTVNQRWDVVELLQTIFYWLLFLLHFLAFSGLIWNGVGRALIGIGGGVLKGNVLEKGGDGCWEKSCM